MICDGCGKEALQGDAFCRQCGSSLGGEAPPTPPPPYRPPAAPVPTTRKTSGWAIASLVMGVLSFMCLPIIGAVLAIVFGAVAKGGIKRSTGDLGGSGLATAGLVLGIVNLSIFIIFAAIMVPWTLVNIGKTKTVTRTVAIQGADRVSATLDMSSGEMNVGGGGDDLFEGTFSYNIKDWEPEIDYGVHKGQGELTVKQGGGWWIPDIWFIHNKWDIAFNTGIPLDLAAVISSGDGYFNLKSLALNSLDIDSSSGDIDADLSGDMPDLRRINIDQSSGDFSIDMKGAYRTYIQMDLENSSGDVSVDLTGQWESALSASIVTSSGDVLLRLPGDVGVRVSVRTRSGDISAPGLTMDREDSDGAVYVNDAFRNSPITLQIDVEVSSGDVSLLVEE